MALLVGIFETQAEAEAAVVRLRELGVPDERLALVAGSRRAGPGSVLETGLTGAKSPQEPIPDHPVSAGVTPPAENRDPTLDSAALGAAVGVIAGGALLGPVGVVLGGIAGTGAGAALAGRSVPREDAETYDASLRQGHYLVAVDTGPSTSDVAATLRQAGALRIETH